MRKFSKILIGTATVLLLFSACQSKSKVEEQSVKQINIDVRMRDSYDNFFSKEYKAVTLETTEESLIGEIKKIHMTDSCIFVFDRDQNTVFEFDDKGYFVRKFYHVGEGEGEYIYLSDFEVHGEYIYLLSRFNKCMYKYTLDDKFVKKINLYDWYDSFYILDDENVLLYSNYSNNLLYNVILFDYQKEKIKEKYLPFKQNDSFTVFHNPFHNGMNGEILLTQLYDHSIYSFNNNMLFKLCDLSFINTYDIPENSNDISLYKLHNSLKDKSVVKSLDCVTIKNSIVYFTYRVDYLSYIAKIDLDMGTSKGNVIEIVDEYPFAFLCPIMFFNNNIVSVSDAESILRMSDDIFESDKNADGLLHEYDNPVIIIRELK